MQRINFCKLLQKFLERIKLRQNSNSEKKYSEICKTLCLQIYKKFNTIYLILHESEFKVWAQARGLILMKVSVLKICQTLWIRRLFA